MLLLLLLLWVGWAVVATDALSGDTTTSIIMDTTRRGSDMFLLPLLVLPSLHQENYRGVAFVGRFSSRIPPPTRRSFAVMPRSFPQRVKTLFLPSLESFPLPQQRASTMITSMAMTQRRSPALSSSLLKDSTNDDDDDEDHDDAGSVIIHHHTNADTDSSAILGKEIEETITRTTTTTTLISSTNATTLPTDHHSVPSFPEHITEWIQTTVLRNVFPALRQHMQRYGHPNIPLGSLAGRQCERIRQLQIQQKLLPEEMEFLSQRQFRWYNLEQVYETASFEELFQRLLRYGRDHNGDVSPPKKYAPDPELGAWVTGIRRKGRDQCNPHHVQRLDEIQFQWTSPRQCGSAFMDRYRYLQQQLFQSLSSSSLLSMTDHDTVATTANTNTTATTTTTTTTITPGTAIVHEVWKDKEHIVWVQQQQQAAREGKLSETRKHYMAQLLQRDDWIDVECPWITSP